MLLNTQYLSYTFQDVVRLDNRVGEILALGDAGEHERSPHTSLMTHQHVGLQAVAYHKAFTRLQAEPFESPTPKGRSKKKVTARPRRKKRREAS